MFRYLVNDNSRREVFKRIIQRNYCQTQYTQGQRADNKIREYFYYIDHDGMVFWNFKNKNAIDLDDLNIRHSYFWTMHE